MSTPLLNLQLMKFRRRVGDVRTEGNVEITESTVGTSDGNIVKAPDLIDIYNAAINLFISDTVANKKPETWYLYFPGYLRYVASLAIVAGRLGLDVLNPAVHAVMGLFDSQGSQQFGYIAPNEYMQTLANKFPNRHPSESELYFTVLADSSGYAILTAPQSSFASVQIVYVRKHVDLIVDNAGGIGTLASAPTAGGTGYAVNDILTLTQGIGGTALVTAINGGIVTAVQLITPGRNYTIGTGKATSGGSGTGCTLNITAVAATDIDGFTPIGLNSILDFAEAEVLKQSKAIAPEYQQKLLELKAKAEASEVKPSVLGVLPSTR